MATQKEKMALFAQKLQDPSWRRKEGLLYKIRDKDGNVVPFITNEAQNKLLDEMHQFNIILKARQLGFTTVIDVSILLDIALWTPNVKCGIIAHSKDAVEEIFNEKIKFVYDNLPEGIKAVITVNTDNAKQLRFSNGSTITVGLSFRSGTLQYLHISELGKVAYKYPEKAREMITGAIPALSQNGMLFIESTAEGAVGIFYELVQTALKLQRSGKKLNPKEPKFFFFPWWENKGYVLDDPDLVLTDETNRYFADLYHSHKIQCSEEQKKWYQTTKELYKKDMMREYPSYPEEAFKVSVKGAYFAKEVSKVYDEKRECLFPYEPALKTYVTMDIGISDAMSIIVYQVNGLEIRLLKWWNVTGFGMVQVHSELLSKLGWNIERVYLPFDGAVRSANDGQTRAETLEKLGYEVEVMRALNVMDSIQLARDTFKYCWFNQAGTVVSQNDVDFSLLDMLNAYREKRDKVSGIGLGKPEHNEASHPADAFRYMCQSLEHIKQALETTVGTTYGTDEPDF